VAFYVAYGGFFQTIVERKDYVAANSLSHGSRAFSFLAGTSLGGVLVQLLRGPYALAVDALSFIWSASFMSQVDAPDPPAGDHTDTSVLAGMRWIRGNAIIRAELLGIATLNFFNLMYGALFLLYATRSLHVRPATLGIVLGAASVGTLLGSFVTGRIARRIGLGPAFLIGCFLFPAPLIAVPAAGGPHWVVVAILFAAEFISGFGLMLLDILAGAMMAGIITRTLRSRVSGAFGLVNNGVRPLGTAAAGVLGSTIGLRPTLWIATVGALAGMLWLLPSPIRTLQDVPDEAT
jgi:predicted MFS family arabinose efflux permease